ncbi:MAG: NAD(P)H-quinone oxidoreductase [Bacteroidetes bacterium]|nr:MAG: NAD(P)H-quinone oxidoreductase [Bacteroidota bacterium]TAG89315.1 MAG: NAD(P)H-quinone oxidoreductase [Bacteroidota bacterium]
MKAILLKSFGDSQQLYLGETPKPIPKQNEILIKTHHFALNRADILQRQGKYSPPQGASEILGLEVVGEIIEIGENVTDFEIGMFVFGLISGGGYAEYAIIPEKMAWLLPDFLTMREAVAIPEAFLTAYQALFTLANLQINENILIHAGGSGIGTAMIQLAKINQSQQIFVTASPKKHQKCIELGATDCIDYHTKNFSAEIQEITQKKGVNVVIDVIGGNYFHQNIDILALDGRMVLLAILGGYQTESINLMKIIGKRLTLLGSTLRNRPLSYQITLKNDFWTYSFELLKDKKIFPVIDSVWNWENIAHAHDYLENNQNIGKIIVDIS